ncbi:hypothetical protein BDV29DRAFT_162862 [Aspergillus leporis]|uniref:Uncharacterized protein n=1 Tax=Aspergillus leporis TaxID=41062 RepID=A0A5N5WJV3_9EURO|nr:hypothetical protein BDV29DRAFT_162862 [Aspergillus leporis]
MQATWSLIYVLAATAAGLYVPEAGSERGLFTESHCKTSHTYCGKRLLADLGFDKHDLLTAVDLSPGQPIGALEHPNNAVFTCGQYGILTFVDYCDKGCKNDSDDHNHCREENDLTRLIPRHEWKISARE